MKNIMKHQRGEWGYNKMREIGVNLGKKFWDKNGEKIKEMYLSTQYSTYEIAELYNITPSTIRRFLYKINVYDKKIQRKNKYIIQDNYIKGYTRNDNYEFIIDKEDYKEIKKYSWHRHQDGYLRTRIGLKPDGRNQYVLMHVLIMKLHNVVIKENEEIDHINGNPADNRFSNLRAVTHQDNMKNSKLYLNNKSGIKGVYWCKREEKWKSEIKVNNKAIRLGTFKNKQDAIIERKKAEEKYFGEFNRR